MARASFRVIRSVYKDSAPILYYYYASNSSY